MRRLYTSLEEQASWASVTSGGASIRIEDRSFLQWLEIDNWHTQGKTLLDAGTGAGQTLIAARSKGMNASGIEVNPTTAHAVREMGFEIYEGEIESFQPRPFRQFDAIVLNQVLEHLAEPSKVLRHLTSFLKSGGRLLFSSPHSDGLSMKWFREKHVHIFSFHHLQLFSIESLDVLAFKAGLSVLHRGTDGSLDMTLDDLICAPLGFGEHRASYLPVLSVPLEMMLRFERKTHLSEPRLAGKDLGSYVIGVFEKP